MASVRRYLAVSLDLVATIPDLVRAAAAGVCHEGERGGTDDHAENDLTHDAHGNPSVEGSYSYVYIL